MEDQEQSNEHLRFCMKLYRMQIENGLYFIHEDEEGNKLWEDPITKRITNDWRVYNVKGNMGIYGEKGERRSIITNSEHIAGGIYTMGKQRKGQDPEEMCRIIMKKLKDQMTVDGRLTETGVGCVFAVEEGESEMIFYDDLTGELLNFEQVIKARSDEIHEFRSHNVYTKVPIKECYDKTGKGPIGGKWIDINKGDVDLPDYRSRYVAKEIKRDNRMDLFAATPPLEAKKLLFSLATTRGVGYSNDKMKGMKIDFIDVKRAYFYAKARRDVYIKLPPEDDEPGMCGKANKSIYGTRDAAMCGASNGNRVCKGKG